MPPLSLSGQVLIESLQALTIVGGVLGAVRRRSRWALGAAVGLSVQPHLALAGTPLRPRDLAAQPLIRAARRVGGLRHGLTIAWTRPDLRREVDALRPTYDDLLAGGTDRFLEPRRRDCPLCGSTDLRHRVGSPDLMTHKPGRFNLDRCRGLRDRVPEPATHGRGPATSTTGTSTTASAPTSSSCSSGSGPTPTPNGPRSSTRRWSPGDGSTSARATGTSR